MCYACVAHSSVMGDREHFSVSALPSYVFTYENVLIFRLFAQSKDRRMLFFLWIPMKFRLCRCFDNQLSLSDGETPCVKLASFLRCSSVLLSSMPKSSACIGLSHFVLFERRIWRSFCPTSKLLFAVARTAAVDVRLVQIRMKAFCLKCMTRQRLSETTRLDQYDYAVGCPQDFAALCSGLDYYCEYQSSNVLPFHIFS